MTLALDVPRGRVAAGIDTDPHPIFGVYSAGNFAEVAPERLSIASWSLVGPPQERAMRALAARLWPGSTWHTGSTFVFLGYFGCRPFHNLSALCHMAEQVPSLTGAQFTASYFEGVEPPAPRGGGRARVGRYAALPRLVREVVTLRKRLMHEQGRAVELEAAAGDALACGSDVALGLALSRAREALDAACEAHMATTACLPALQAVQRTIGERATPFWDELEPWVNRPPELVWSWLHEAAAADMELGQAEFLGAPFYEIAHDHSPWDAYATAEHRAGTPAPQRPSRLDPVEAFWRMPGQGSSRVLRTVACAVDDTMAARELGKSLVMRTLHVFRKLLPAVAAAQGVPAGDWPYLMVQEIADAHGPEAVEALADQRRSECEVALAEPVPELIDFGGAHDGAPTSSPAAGRGISGGSVTGVVVGPDLECPAPDSPRILVADALDAGVQPLLSRVQGVLTRRGSLLSHVAILAREWGVPAVAGHPLAAAVRPGDSIRLDGSTGEVALVEP